MLALAACAAVVSVAFALLSFFKDGLATSQTVETASPAASPVATVKGSPTSDRPVVEVAQANNQAPAPTEQAPPPEIKRQAIVEDTIILEPRRFRSYRFIVKDEYRNPRITGRVMASGGGRDDIVLLIVDEQGFRNYSGGDSALPFFRSRVLGAKNISTNLRPGVYHLIFSNNHARFYVKQVEARLFLEFD
jgi:hypothetical protein